MLQAFTWQQFLIAALIFSLVWLVIVVVVFYRKELFNLLSGRSEPVEPLAHNWKEDFEELSDEGLMGKPALPDGVSIVEQDEFSFKPREVIEAVVPDEVLQTDVFDLMENLKPLLENKKLDKEDFIELVNEQVQAYGRLINSPLLDSVYESICEQVNASNVLQFELSAEELKENL